MHIMCRIRLHKWEYRFYKPATDMLSSFALMCRWLDNKPTNKITRLCLRCLRRDEYGSIVDKYDDGGEWVVDEWRTNIPLGPDEEPWKEVPAPKFAR